jgi:hypothetical protein
MQPGLYRNLDGPVGLVLTGPAATAVVLSPIEGGIEISEMGSDGGPPLATVTSTTADFLAWSTTRLPWRERVEIDGDEVVAAKFFDALNLT